RSFDQCFNLLAQSLANPPAMVFQPALLHRTAPQVKRMRISEKWAQVCEPEALWSRAVLRCSDRMFLSTEVTMRCGGFLVASESAVGRAGPGPGATAQSDCPRRMVYLEKFQK